MKKIIKKISFIINTSLLGNDIKNKIKILIYGIIIQINFYTKKTPKPFSATIKNNNQKSTINFRGTMDEMHALTEIFIDRCYDPKIKDVKKVLDLGANIGLASVWFCLEFPNCQIHSYEPNPEVFVFLKKNLAYFDGAKVFNMAISDKTESTTFHVSNRSFSSSEHQIPNSQKIEVPTKSLDLAITEIGYNIDVLKIDIEGSEYDVLKQSKLLNKINVIVGESHKDKAGLEKDSIKDILSASHRDFIQDSKDKSIFYAKR